MALRSCASCYYKRQISDVCDLTLQGLRVVGLATKEFTKALVNLCPEDEQGMVFQGFLAFLDPPKASAIPSICDFKEKGIDIKVRPSILGPMLFSSLWLFIL